jgi:hypothetical protein
VPNVYGHTSSQAKQHLQNSGLTAGSISKQITKRGWVGTIVGQSPDPYTRVPPGTAVTLIEEQEDVGKKTREAIERIRSTEARPDSFDFASRRDTGLQTGKTKITIENDTNHTLYVHFSGPEAQTIPIPKGNSQEIVLVSGDYEVAAEVNDPKVKSLYAKRTLRANYHYIRRFYIRH